VVALFTFAHSPAAGAQAGDSSARVVVNLLDYLARDYAGAVTNGAVTNASEYREQVEFARSALSIGSAVPEIRDDTALVAGLRALGALIDRKASAADVSAAALDLRQRIVVRSAIAQSPARWPSLEHGRALYRQNCASCHGSRGAGDGPAGAALDPKPANFLSPAIANGITPFRAFNAIRVGLPKTPMAAHPELNDADIWDVAFYVTSMHIAGAGDAAAPVTAADLAMVAAHSDSALMLSLPGDTAARRSRIAALRLHSSADAAGDPLAIARAQLALADAKYAAGDPAAAKQAALRAYLEGIEPVEPRLRANDLAFTEALEGKMADVRAAIEGKQPAARVSGAVAAADRAIDAAAGRLAAHASGPWVTFVLTTGILLREGFEAVLILIALLAVIRAANNTTAEWWVHGGWLTALAAGIIAWFLSGWLMAISGVQRELLEGITSLLAVAVLLYVGFWLHSRTEITRWRHFLDVQVRSALEGKKLWVLFTIAFMALFREAFECVLFLRAITLEGGTAGTTAMTFGVVTSFALLFGLSWALLKYSARIPIRRIFTISSLLMAVLAVILVGKGLHSLQETGILPITSTWWHWSSDLLGIYATWETFIPQLVTVAALYTLWVVGKRPTTRTA
jgi:high-affinity iron transporter